ncbi:hypothetical protein BC629DRAFT_1477691, partial [Irpex lacteus]
LCQPWWRLDFYKIPLVVASQPSPLFPLFHHHLFSCPPPLGLKVNVCVAYSLPALRYASL